jgi:hypothetical protein
MDNSTWGKKKHIYDHRLRDHPLNKCTSVVFDSKKIGDLKPMTAGFFFRIYTFVFKKDNFPKRNTSIQRGE